MCGEAVVEKLDHDFGDVGIKLGSGAAGELVDSLSLAQAAAVGAGAGHGVVGVGDADDTADEGDVVAPQTLVVTGAVVILMMIPMFLAFP